ncbi:MAG: hypothetical protein RL077_4696 [Verrucomicrobiota bacterium]
MLMVIGGLAWDLTARFNRERLDREMRNIAKANLQRTGDEKHWQRAEEALRFVAGPDRSFEHVLWVKNYDRVVDRSPRWTTEIAPENYPPPTRYADGLAFTTPPRRHAAWSFPKTIRRSRPRIFFSRRTLGRVRGESA